MRWTDNAKFVLFGKRGDNDNFTHTQAALGDFEMGDLDFPTKGVNENIRNSNPHYNGSNRNKILKTLADLRLDIFSIRQIAYHLKADPVQIQDILNELVVDGILERVPKRRGVYAFSDSMKRNTFSPPNRQNYQQPPNDMNLEALKQMIEEQLFVLNKKIDFWASRIQSSNDIERKQKAPNAIISEFKGKIIEVVNTLKVIEMPGSDRDLGDLILQYKDARREGLIAKEREIGYEVVDRLDAMVSVYLHLTRTFNEFNKYMIDLYKEGVIKDFDNDGGEEFGTETTSAQHPPAESQQKLPPQQKLPSTQRPPPRPPPEQQRIPEVEPVNDAESEDISQFDEGEGAEFVDEGLDDNA